jgi:hypothetical protein
MVKGARAVNLEAIPVPGILGTRRVPGYRCLVPRAIALIQNAIGDFWPLFRAHSTTAHRAAIDEAPSILLTS